MSIYSLLIEEHSKKQAQYIVDQITLGNESLSELIDILFSDDMRLRQKASWPLSLIGEQHEELIYPYIAKMISELENSRHDSIPRNVFRTWQNMHFNNDIEGEIYDIAFAYLSNPQNAIAIKVFAMSTCTNIAIKYPELAEELIIVIEEQLEHGSAGYLSRAKKELKRLRTINK